MAEEEEEEGKEQIPNGTLARLKSESGGISIQDFIMLRGKSRLMKSAAMLFDDLERRES